MRDSACILDFLPNIISSTAYFTKPRMMKIKDSMESREHKIINLGPEKTEIFPLPYKTIKEDVNSFSAQRLG